MADGECWLSTLATGDEHLAPFADTGSYIMSSLHEFSGQITGFDDIKNAKEKGAELADKMQSLSFNNASNSIRRGLNALRDAKAAVIVEQDRTRRGRAFTILYFSAEKRLAELFGNGSSPREGGDQARLIEIPVAAASAGGIFCKVPEGERPDFVGKLQRLLSTQCGRIMPRWVRFLAKQDVRALDAKNSKWEGEFKDQINHMNPLHQRIGKSFALIAATSSAAA